MKTYKKISSIRMYAFTSYSSRDAPFNGYLQLSQCFVPISVSKRMLLFNEIRSSHKSLPALQTKSYAISVFLDFTACFDTVSRECLLSKLQRYGVRGVGLNLVSSYFTNRKQYVSFRGINSTVVSQDIGVIQGSKNGPLFYDIYSNDLNYICDDRNVMFADDSCLVYMGDDLADLVVCTRS